jgi:SanA protein
MQMALIEYGVPKDKIFLDFAGFRTLDSVVRAKEIFGQNQLIIVSQKFHNERAVFLAQQNGMEAFGYNAPDVNKYAGLKTNLREYFAKAKAYWDLLLELNLNLEEKRF